MAPLVGLGRGSGVPVEPVLVDLDLDGIVVAPGIAGPQVALPETHPVERLLGQAVAAIGAPLRVAEVAAQAFDDAGPAAAVVRGADVTRRIALLHPHPITGGEAGAHFRSPSPAAGGAGRARSEATRASISAWVSTPFSTRIALIDAIQRA